MSMTPAITGSSKESEARRVSIRAAIVKRALIACIAGLVGPATIAPAHEGGRRLEKETSPYLLDHVHDEIEWHPWGAADDKRLILVSIGRFGLQSLRRIENEFFALLDPGEDLNRRLVCIKVDYDERPDVAAAAYAVARLSRETPVTIPRAPLVLLLLPDGRPVWGAPLAPESRARLLLLVRDHENEAGRRALCSRAMGITAATREILAPAPGQREIDATIVSSLTKRVMENARRPRAGATFRPAHGALRLMLGEHLRSNPAMAQELLLKITRSGLHDQIGGGFHHEAIDENGRLPRFEKRLGDNALLAWALSRSHRKAANPLLRQAALNTLAWARREMLDPNAGFTAALDAETDGVEGGYYLWTRNEILGALGRDKTARLFGSYELGPRGVLYRRDAPADASDLASELREQRNRRLRPSADTRVFADANGLMISALAAASRAFDTKADRDLARRVARSVLERLGPPASLRHGARGAVALGPAFLTDHAALSLGLLDLHEATNESRWLNMARDLIDEAIRRFLDARGGFFETDAAHEPVVIRMKSFEDGEGLSGNGAMALALHRLAYFTGETRYDDLALRTVSAFYGRLEADPASATALIAAAAELVAPPATPSPIAGAHPSRTERGPVTARVALSRISARRGETFEARISLAIAKPWSVVAAQSESKDLASLIVAILDPELTVGSPNYPLPVTIEPAFDEKPLAVHAGHIAIVAPLRVPDSAPPGERPVRVRVRYQLCDRHECRPPESVVLETPFFIPE
ncbi:MAG: thioredoxin domain-containing protein [Vicinamibacteria bacterium]|nr:thioredoxin domain-containing protein [Vicinamibacteria bacterium]